MLICTYVHPSSKCALLYTIFSSPGIKTARINLCFSLSLQMLSSHLWVLVYPEFSPLTVITFCLSVCLVKCSTSMRPKILQRWFSQLVSASLVTQEQFCVTELDFQSTFTCFLHWLFNRCSAQLPWQLTTHFWMQSHEEQKLLSKVEKNVASVN